MHAFLLTALHAASSTTTGSKKSSSSSSSVFIFVLLGAFIIVYFFFLRPRSQRARQQAQAKAKDFSLGDEVVSIGGIVGKVVGFDGDDVEVEVDDGVVLTFLRRAVNLRNAPQAAGPTAGGGLFGRRPQPAPVRDDDDDFDEDDDDQPAISSGSSGSSGSGSSRAPDGGSSGKKGNKGPADGPDVAEGPGDGTGSPPTGR